MNTTQFLLERLIKTNGFSVRNNKEDEVYWYTSGIPGPFYINTENIVGENVAEKILKKINEILAGNSTNDRKVSDIFDLIHSYVKADEGYRNSIDALDRFLYHR